MKRIVWVTALLLVAGVNRPLALLVLLLLAGCNLNPPQRHVTSSGQACVQAGPPWAQSWLTPDRRQAC